MPATRSKERQTQSEMASLDQLEDSINNEQLLVDTTSIDSLRARLKLSTEQLTRAHLDNQPANIIQQMQTESEQLIACIALIQRSEQYLSPEKDNSNISTQTT
ncbi:hypothetical protein BDF20DRAFT_835824, partial [Mycotypha africana]|uniref:uncharacterized protein n=1 Tax=Mycotypha africana TaxID=64632 RepID=UPI0022FFF48D